jgi:hypothetical protein
VPANSPPYGDVNACSSSRAISLKSALMWPEAQQRIKALLERGLQREVDFENRWPEVLGTLVET